MKGRALLVLACLAAAGPALAAPISLGLEATVGGQRLGITRAPGSTDALAPMGEAGATALLRVGPIGIGAAFEGNFDGTTLQQYNASAMGGLVTDLLPVLRLELMGEVGAANLRSGSDLRAAAEGGEWQRFYGFRPGLSARIPVLPFRVGLWGLARWGLPGTEGVELGVLGRLGLEF